MDSIQDPVLILDENFVVISANKSFYKNFIADKKNIIGVSFFESGDKQWDSLKLRTLLQLLIQKELSFKNFEIILKSKNNKRVFLLNGSLLLALKKKKTMLICIKDITEYSLLKEKTEWKTNQANSQHKKIKMELEKAIEETTVLLLQSNNNLKILNKELVFQNAEKEKRGVELGVANKELAFQNSEKEKRANELEVANIELAFQNSEKEERAKELRLANQDLTAFTFISSHDLQEPLRKIQTFISRIYNEEQIGLSENGKVYLKKIEETSGRMRHLLHDLITYSQIKADERIFEEVDIRILLQEVIKDFEEQIANKKAVITIINSESIRIIPFQFRQLLENLISNSLKFTKPSLPPAITIKTKIMLSDASGSKKKFPQGRYVHLSIKDNGIGFDPQFKDRIFEVFQRLHSKEDFAGTGMGLTICKKIVDNHNGIITATGKPNIGTRFDIYIPIQEAG